MNVGVEIWRTRALDRTKCPSVIGEARPSLKGCSAKEEE
jgi:hypothetical protein